jgi:hypothetical protein
LPDALPGKAELAGDLGEAEVGMGQKVLAQAVSELCWQEVVAGLSEGDWVRIGREGEEGSGGGDGRRDVGEGAHSPTLPPSTLVVNRILLATCASGDLRLGRPSSSPPPLPLARGSPPA